MLDSGCQLSPEVSSLQQCLMQLSGSGRKDNEEIASPFTCCPVNREYLWKKTQIEKKKQKTKGKFCFTARKTEVWSMMDEGRLNSWRRSLSYRNQPMDLRSKSMDWFLYDRDLRHVRANVLLLVYIYRDVLIERYSLIMIK